MSIFGLITKKEMNEIKSSKRVRRLRAKSEAEKETQGRIEEALKAQAENTPWLLDTAAVQKFEMPSAQTYGAQAETDRTSASVSTAVEILSKTAASTMYNVVKRDGEDEVEESNHPYEMRLESPNEEDSSFEFFWYSYKQRLLTGNCYWWMNRKDEFSEPDEIWPIPAHMIMPVPDENLYIKGYVYDPYGSPYAGVEYGIPLQAWEIIHFKRPNPFNRFVGLSIIEALIIDIIGERKAKEWNTQFFADNNARLPGILAFASMVSDTDWARLNKEVTDHSKKRNQMMLRGVGKGGIDWMKAGATQGEMEFLDGLGVSRDTIWNAFSPGLVSMLDPSATEASSKTGKSVFMEFGVWPLLQEFAAKQTQKIMPTYGEGLILKAPDVRIADREMLNLEIQTYMETHTIDQVNAKHYKEDPLEDGRGDQFVVEIGGSEPDQGETELEEPSNPIKSKYDIDLDRYKTFALNRIGQTPRKFKSEHIPEDTLFKIHNGLKACKNKKDISRLFSVHTPKEIGAVDIVDDLRKLTSAVKEMK